MTTGCKLVLLQLPAFVLAQEPLKYEVATIKPAPPDSANNRWSPEGPDRMLFQMTLRNLIYWAYGNGLSTAVRVSGGPDWISRNRYDVEVLAPRPATQRQFRSMLRDVLQERFALKTHTETQTIDVYALVPARTDGKLGPKVQEWDGTCGERTPPADDDPTIPRCTAVFRPPGMFLEGVTMFAVAEMLSASQPAVGRIVEDRTGLTGRDKLELEFVFAPARAGQPDPGGPSIFTAVREQWD